MTLILTMTSNLPSLIETINQAGRIVIKIGSALLTDEANGQIKAKWLESVINDIANLKQQGKDVLIVTSGAIALGRKAMNIADAERPSSIRLERKQAAAAIGQIQLARHYDDALAVHGLQSALILLTPRDTENRRTHLNARNTLNALLKQGIVPIINENDTVSTDEIRFGDNDRLAARIAQMVDADLLIQLSTTDGLYTDNPDTNPDATHIPHITKINDELMKMAGDAPAGLSTGGMRSKLLAADICMNAGIAMIITNGTNLAPLHSLINDQEGKATLFHPTSTTKSARKKWISSHVEMKGTLTIDDGAVQALQSGKSLLCAGIVKISGDFSLGDPVEIIDKNGHRLASGLSGYSADEARIIIGKKSEQITELLGYARGNSFIHRDDLVL